MSPNQTAGRIEPRASARGPRLAVRDVRCLCGKSLPLAALFTAVACCHSCLGAEDLRGLVLEAAKATKENLKSGSGEGVYRRWDPKGNLTYDIPFSITFKGDKYRLRLHYRKKPSAHSIYDNRIVVSDGSAIFSRDVGEDGQGAPGEITNDYIMATRGIPLDLVGRTRPAFPSASVFEHTVKLEKLPDGTIRGAYDMTAKARVTFDCSPQVAYRLVRYENLRNTGKRRGVEYTYEWRHEDGTWYVHCFHWDIWREDDLVERMEMRYDKFRPNVAVGDETFTLASLGLKPGDHLLDHRAGRQSPFHEVEQPADARGKHVDSMVAQLKALPWKYPEKPLKGSWWPRVGVIAINVLAALAVALIWLAWRKRVRHKTGV
jgi:hypothetical protein